MKYFVIALAFIGLGFSNSNAQTYYKIVREAATKVINNPNSSQEMIDINQFEITALNYMIAQVAKRGIYHHEYFYDIQAVYMKSFVDDFLYYVIEARKISSTKKKQVVECFKNASLQCPMFNDTDKRTTHVYMNDPNSLTPFCLDTDWDAAYELVSKNIKAIMR